MGNGLLRVKKAPWMPEYSIYFIDSSRQVMRAPQVENLVDDSAALMRAAQLTSETSATIGLSAPFRPELRLRREETTLRGGLG